MKTFILPRKNERDLLDIPEHLRRDVEFVLVDRIEQVIEAALLSETDKT